MEIVMIVLLLAILFILMKNISSDTERHRGGSGRGADCCFYCAAEYGCPGGRFFQLDLSGDGAGVFRDRSLYAS